jgi:multidrug transporter EmrE-like cation transporter
MMQTVHLTCYLIITILAKSLGVGLLPYTERFNKKIPSTIYFFTSLLSYYALSTYIAYLDFSLIIITLSGACLCINMIWVALKGNFSLSGEKLLGAGLVLAGGILSIVL